MKTEKPFERNISYLVVKINDIRTASACGILADEQRRKLEDIVGIIGTRECVVVEKDWPEYELVWSLIRARVAAEGSLEERAKLQKSYYEALSVLHELLPKPEKPAAQEIVKHWYLVSWISDNGLCGNSEIWTDKPWKVGDFNAAVDVIKARGEESGHPLSGVTITSVFPINP